MTAFFQNLRFGSWQGPKGSLGSADFVLRLAHFAGQKASPVLCSSMYVGSLITLLPRLLRRAQNIETLSPFSVVLMARLQVIENASSTSATPCPPSPLFSILTKSLYRQCFVSHTYKKAGVGPLRIPALSFPYQRIA